MPANKNIKIFLNYFLGPLLFVWLSVSIYKQIKHQPDLGNSWIKIKQSVQSSKIWNLVAVLALMIVNWSIEAWKWKIVIRPVQRLSFVKSFSAILSGVSFSVNTPNRIGEYLGRLLYVDEGNRLKLISLTIVGSMSQLIMTLFAGCAGLFFLGGKIGHSGALFGSDPATWIRVLQYTVVLILLILTVIYFRLSLLTGIVRRLPYNARYAWLFQSLQNVRATMLVKLLSLSAVRYLVFIVQYFLIFRLFEVNINWWECLGVVSVIFLVLAIIPTFAIAELGLRGKVSLKLMALFTINSLGVSIATATIWLINLVLPAIAGSLLILSIKIFKNRNERI